jgi:hypothetical protein
MRQELDPSSIIHTSDFTGFVGLRVVIRKAPNNGHFGTGHIGRSTRVSAIFAPGKPFEISYSDADGAVAIWKSIEVRRNIWQPMGGCSRDHAQPVVFLRKSALSLRGRRGLCARSSHTPVLTLE